MKNSAHAPIARHHYGRWAFAILIVVILVLLVLAIAKGLVEDYDKIDSQTEPGTHQTEQVQSAPEGTLEPSNPNVTGGSSGGGTGQSNDESTPSSPAGGVDTNNQQTP